MTVGAPDRILLVGAVVSPGEAYQGQVLVVGATIACAAPGEACAALPEATGATVIVTHGVIAPGLIDTHNHILFDIFNDDDWLPAQVYQNHDQWPNEPKYAEMLDVKQCLEDASQGKPPWCPAKYDGAGSLKCEMDKFGELKGLVAGTTSIVGLPGTSSACFGSLARSIDVAQNGGLGPDRVQTAVALPSTASADGVCANFTDGDTKAYLVHCGEGVDATALNEFEKLRVASTVDGCLYAPQTAITHGTAFGPEQFATMAAAQMKLIWSPASNYALYRATTNVPAALDAGLTVALAPDWSMGGSQNLLDELRFAQAWDDEHFGDRLSSRDLVQMTTANAAAVLGVADKIGRLEAGMVADLIVVGGDLPGAFDAVVAATPRGVRLTMVGGRVLYGDDQLRPAAPPAIEPKCETLDICGRAKFLCVAEDSAADKLGQTFAVIKNELEAALLDVDAQTPGDNINFSPLAPLVRCPLAGRLGPSCAAR
ncbi:MAG TPA: amidohydrolase family protein [Polyangiaceae bacterium]|nr:amidohydrolase family protein [Polyangiaceae bacterium]